ncbi:uncharacterized protein LOC129818397 isoform X2 [Salvelinus fontinalis]|uniref:uncharacterized protein LOC129818397 isoform X2 n=1 Tax=Salvelinus fontinalis TaxID=8038 RepID=UPI0024850BA5|nr:uncharacterized protein LOC129818397 isoform X2 [Salvelinus fontinalis]
MSPSYFLMIFVAGVAVRKCYADSVPTSSIVLSPGYINAARSVKVRCESTEGTECYFYRDQDPTPIRKVDYNSVCQFTLFWDEFKTWNKSEVDLSCAILQKREGKMITSERSDTRRLHVSDPIGKPSVDVEQRGKYLNLRCEAQHGTSCYFYLNNGDLHFKKQPYKDNVCVGRVAQEELLTMRKRSSPGEIFITCSVEMVIKGNSVTSQHSEPLSITVDGATGSIADFSSIPPGEEKAVSEVISLTTQEEDPSSRIPLYIGLRAGLYVLILLVESLLCFLWCRHGDERGNNSRRKRTQVCTTL